MPKLTEAQRLDINREILDARKSHERKMEGIDTSFTDEIYRLKAKLALMQSLADDSIEMSELLYLTLEHLSIAKEMLSDAARMGGSDKMRSQVDELDMQSAILFEMLYC